jgi:hypothetical protein
MRGQALLRAASRAPAEWNPGARAVKAGRKVGR